MSRWTTRAAWLSCTVLGGVVPVRAHAQPGPNGEPIVLEWRAPAGCPSADDVKAETLRLLGGAPTVSGKRVIARAEVRALEPGRFRLEVRTESSGAAGERRLEADVCHTLADAAALIIALALDAEAVARAQQRPGTGTGVPEQAPWPSPAPVGPGPAPAPVGPGPAPAPAPDGTSVAGTHEAPAGSAAPTDAPPSVPTVAPPPARAAQPAHEMPRSTRPRLAAPAAVTVRGLIGAALSGDAGALPAPSAGITAFVGLAFGRARAELSGTYWFGQRATMASRPSAGGDFSFAVAAASGCAMLLRSVLEVGPCGGIELGRMAASGFGVTHPGDGEALWAAARVGAVAVWTVTSRFGVRLDAGAAVPFDRRRWKLEGINADGPAADSGILHRPGIVGGRAAIGLELRL